VKVLVVEAHERELDALELAFLDRSFGGAKAHLTDLLPIGVRRGTLANTRHFQDFCTQIVRRECRRCRHAHERGTRKRHRAHACCALQ
jgi:hypothetical protein